jgi:hypothetical protein
MFTLLSPSKSFPSIKTVDIKDIHLYVKKFEESLRNFEELQKESAHNENR